MIFMKPNPFDRDDDTDITVDFLAILAIIMFLAGIGISSCKGQDPEDDEGHAVLCDFACVSVDEGKDACEWVCEGPEIEVACQDCDYTIRSGKAEFKCTECDVGAYQ